MQTMVTERQASGADLTAASRRAFFHRDTGKGSGMKDVITIRQATDADRSEIRRLAALDDRPVPRGGALLAFVDGDLRAALAVSGHRAVADPFHPTSELVALLRFHAERMGGQEASRPGSGRGLRQFHAVQARA